MTGDRQHQNRIKRRLPASAAHLARAREINDATRTRAELFSKIDKSQIDRFESVIQLFSKKTTLNSTVRGSCQRAYQCVER